MLSEKAGYLEDGTLEMSKFYTFFIRRKASGSFLSFVKQEHGLTFSFCWGRLLQRRVCYLDRSLSISNN